MMNNRLEDIPDVEQSVIAKIKDGGYVDILGLIVALPEWIAEDCQISYEKALEVKEKANLLFLYRYENPV